MPESNFFIIFRNKSPQNGQKLVTYHQEFVKGAIFIPAGCQNLFRFTKELTLDVSLHLCKDVVMTTRRLLQIVFGFVVMFPVLFVYFLLAEPAGFVFDKTIGKWS